jgi:hypothetical protein
MRALLVPRVARVSPKSSRMIAGSSYCAIASWRSQTRRLGSLAYVDHEMGIEDGVLVHVLELDFDGMLAGGEVVGQ